MEECEKKRALLAWSSGKDSAWALHELRVAGAVQVVGLLTTVNATHERVAMHGVRREVLRAQADACGLPLWEVPIPYPCDNATYEAAMRGALERARSEGIAVMAFGDLFLEEVRAYRVKNLLGTGIEPLFPLWGRPTSELVREMIAGGLRAELACIDPSVFPRAWAGRSLDAELLERLPEAVDPCGERGEFHTLVVDGPMFTHPLPVRRGVTVERDGFVFTDFVLETSERARASATEPFPRPSEAVRRAALQHQAELTKPPGSLGRLEGLATRFASCRGSREARVREPQLLVFAADHGVVAEGVSAYPQAVTRAMLSNVLGGGAAVSVLARAHRVHIELVDVGVLGEPLAAASADGVTFVTDRVRAGSRNLLREPALEAAEANAAWAAGERSAQRAIQRGATVIGVGELGIGNTTSAAALIAGLTGDDPEALVGRGTGLDDAALAHKQAVVRSALARTPRDASAFDWLLSVGGLELAALAGAITYAARQSVPVLLDGVITNAAACAAVALDARVRPFLIASHRSQEPAASVALAWLGLDALLELELRLGEGTGAVLGLNLLSSASLLANEMATFSSARVPNREHLTEPT
jgi:nicotinate-nucleotide--dimethylbenzimidazole phosphoribosyltransferase